MKNAYNIDGEIFPVESRNYKPTESDINCKFIVDYTLYNDDIKYDPKIYILKRIGGDWLLLKNETEEIEIRNWKCLKKIKI
jgi:hypothetical protein